MFPLISIMIRENRMNARFTNLTSVAGFIVALSVVFSFSFSATVPESCFAASTSKEKKAESKVAGEQRKNAKKSSKNLPSQKSVSVNKASKEELMTVPGIGPKTAEAIIAYRKSKPFDSVDDLTKVKGIGEKSLAKMKQYLKK